MAGTVKGRKAARHATSDWMRLEQQRGISVTSSVMQFPYRDCIVNLLDTPGHEDFSEDTYRTLTAVDSALMVIDCAKGVEERTIKLMEVCRLRDTPIMTFINKLDREGRAPIELLDEIEHVLKIQHRAGHLADRHGTRAPGHLSPARGPHLRLRGRRARPRRRAIASSTDSRARAARRAARRRAAAAARRRSSWCAARPRPSIPRRYRAGAPDAGVLRLGDQQFRRRGTAARRSSATRRRRCRARRASAASTPLEPKLTGFVFKIQANMDPGHRDRIAFMRLCSGRYQRGMRLHHVRLGKEVRIADALTFMAADRAQAEEAFAGDIIGLHNHGTINIGDTLHRRRGAALHRHPELRARRSSAARCCKDPLRMKALQQGPGSAVRGGRDAAVPAAAQQRPDPRRGRAAAVRGGRLPPAGRIRRAVRVRDRSPSTPRAGSAATIARKLEEFRTRAYEQPGASITAARWSIWRPRA